MLGEGILWCAQRGILLWTDIKGALLWMHRPHVSENCSDTAAARTHAWSLPDRLGSLALCESGQLLLGLAKGLYVADFDADIDELASLTLLAPVEAHETRTRINDGRCDRAGNFVFGTTNEHGAREPIGSFYQYSARHGLRRLDLGGVGIPNSLCFSPDGNTLYYCDSRQPRILQCDYDAASAGVANCRTFVTLPPEAGSPDGSTVDADGCVWNAQWGGARVVRYAPQGRVDRVIQLAAQNPSCVAFGGPRLNQLYITTARDELSDQALQQVPESGGVYRWSEPGLRGLPEQHVRLA